MNICNQIQVEPYRFLFLKGSFHKTPPDATLSHLSNTKPTKLVRTLTQRTQRKTIVEGIIFTDTLSQNTLFLYYHEIT